MSSDKRGRPMTWGIRILNRNNIIPFIIAPTVLWGFDLLIQFSGVSFLNPKVWFAFLTLSLPSAGYFLIIQIYKLLKNKLPDIILPEITGLIGFLYGQPTYMILSKLIIEGVNSISLKEAIKTIMILTPIVPISTIMISSYDGSLLAVPLTCLAMILAGLRYRKIQRAKEESKGTASI